MELKPIRNEQDYEAALMMVSPYFDHEPDVGTPEADHFEILLMLIEQYESLHYPVMPPDPVEAIRFRMEQAELTVKDMESVIGKSNRVYEILNRKRPLTLPMIRRLHRDLGIPADSLIGETVNQLSNRSDLNVPARSSAGVRPLKRSSVAGVRPRKPSGKSGTSRRGHG